MNFKIKIDIDNTTFTYGDVRDTMLETDEDPDNSQNVLLVYGYNNSKLCDRAY